MPPNWMNGLMADLGLIYFCGSSYVMHETKKQ